MFFSLDTFPSLFRIVPSGPSEILQPGCVKDVPLLIVYEWLCCLIRVLQYDIRSNQFALCYCPISQLVIVSKCYALICRSSLFAAIFNFKEKAKLCLELQVGEAVYIVKESGDWFYGSTANNRDCYGIFPKPYIQIRESSVDKSGCVTFEACVINGILTKFLFQPYRNDCPKSFPDCVGNHCCP
jgi:hypothetical protein